MTPELVDASRRDFLQRSVAGAVGLSAAGFWLELCARADSSAEGADHVPGRLAGDFEPNAFVHISADGEVTLVCWRSEMGQGIRSSLPVLLAAELGADMKRVKILQADGDKVYGDQNTDGSSSVRGHLDPMRKIAATARVMLVSAAAKKWKVDPAACRAHQHFVIHEPTGRKLAFGALTEAASQEKVPAEVRLLPLSTLKELHPHMPVLDAPAYVTGTAQFGADLRLPGMLIASIARPPVVGGKIRKVDSKKALAVAGVRKVIEIPTPQPPYAFQPWGGVAVLADNTWAALRGRAALELEIEWEHGANSSYDSDRFREDLSDAVHAPGLVVRNTGDVDQALTTAFRKFEAEYHVPHLPHVPMEPPVALARVSADLCEVWACTQNPQAARKEAARVLGWDEKKVHVHTTFLGGGFGRKSKADFVSEAVFLAKAAGVPVRVQWTREDDVTHDYYNAVSAQLLTAGIDDKGKVIAWRHRTGFTPIPSLFTGTEQPTAGDLQQGVLDLPLAVPNVRAEACAAKVHARIGWLRSVYNIFHAFAISSFIDELAHELKRDPREMILELLGPPRLASEKELGIKELKNYGAPLSEHPVDAGRLRHVVERVTEISGWAHRHKNKRALGLAAHRSFLSYAGVVVSVFQDKRGRLGVDEAWIVIDAGQVINLDRVRSQMEGAVIFGESIAFHGAITMKVGVTEQTNFDTIKVARMRQAPRKIHVEVVESELAPCGVGEPGVPPVAPAIANAVFALTGKRVRDLPLDRAGIPLIL